MPPETTTEVGRYNIVLRQGGTYRRVMVWTIDDTPVDLSGCTIFATFRVSTITADPPLLQLTIGSGITLDGPAGEITLAITDEQTATNLSGSWDLKINWVGGDETYLLAGKVTWRRAVTR